MFGDFVYIGAFGRDAGKRGSENVWVHDSTFSRNGRQGLAITAGENVVFEHNQIGETRRATVDLEPNSPRFGAKNVHILENIVGEGRLLFLASHGNGPVDDIVISRNQLPGHPLTMSVRAAGERRARWWVTDNVAQRTERTPMSFQRIDGVVVRNNTEPVTREGASGVGLRDVCGANVSGNNFLPAIQESSASGELCDFTISAIPPDPPSIRGRGPRRHHRGRSHLVRPGEHDVGDDGRNEHRRRRRWGRREQHDRADHRRPRPDGGRGRGDRGGHLRPQPGQGPALPLVRRLGHRRRGPRRPLRRRP